MSLTVEIVQTLLVPALVILALFVGAGMRQRHLVDHPEEYERARRAANRRRRPLFRGDDQ
jgi:hypothetical protein